MVNVHVYDEAGRELVVPVVWEAERAGTDCIKIHNNKMTASKVGIYRIRASYEELVSDWIEVTVEEE